MSANELLNVFRNFHTMLACVYINQASYAQNIFPETTNTLRILTLIDPDSNQAFLAAAVHRFGTCRSGAVDNWAAGGLSAHVNPLTGQLGRGFVYQMGNPPLSCATHPDTGSTIEGVIVPGWEALSKRLLSVANKWSFIPYIGWDIVVTEGGFQVLEGNNSTSVDLFQVHEPLLSNPRIKRFYHYHNVIS